jgi:membrane protease YdiL (CAAX protease family)
VGEFTGALGLDRYPPFYRDALFHAALLAGVLFWSVLWLFIPVRPIALSKVLSWTFLSLALWQPLLEELLFRGFLQGQLHKPSWGRWRRGGITVANVMTSLLFTLGHGWYHPSLWTLGVMAPSLIFGYFRDRYSSVYPSMVLHGFYNAGYFLLT